MNRSAPHPPPKRLGPLPWPVLLLLVLCICPEMVLQLIALVSDQNQAFYLRSLAYTLGAFQPGIMTGYGPLFPGQSISMFITYGFLHTGISHLLVNMIGLIWLGRLVLTQRTSETFLTFYLLSTIGAAEVFALIGPAGGTMVGASGALFGLLGGYLVDNSLLFGRNAPSHLLPQVARLLLVALGLILADLGSSMLLGSTVAWQAHAGGFVTGGLVAVIAPLRNRPTA